MRTVFSAESKDVGKAFLLLSVFLGRSLERHPAGSYYRSVQESMEALLSTRSPPSPSPPPSISIMAADGLMLLLLLLLWLLLLWLLWS